jgi:hypothetical protein
MSRNTHLADTWKIRYYQGYEKCTALITARDSEQAKRIAKGYPNVTSLMKVDYIRITSYKIDRLVETLEREARHVSPMSMDEMIWNRQRKRMIDKEKDKKDY